MNNVGENIQQLVFSKCSINKVIFENYNLGCFRDKLLIFWSVLFISQIKGWEIYEF